MVCGPSSPGIGRKGCRGGRVGGRIASQLQMNQAGVKCLCCFSPPLPKINNCVNSRVIVLGRQPPGLPGLGRCWQGLPEPHRGAGWAWLPGLQDKHGRTQAGGREGGREAAGRRENRCLRSEADTKDLLSPPPWPQGAAPSSQPTTRGQVSQGLLGVREGQVLTSRRPLPLGAWCFFCPR